LAYAGTTTPVLSWGVPAAVPASSRWQVCITDYSGDNVLFKSELLPSATNTFAVPDGFLQSNSAYAWAVILWDGNMANGVWASTKFHTGSRATSLPWAYLISEPPTINTSSFINYSSFAIGVLPDEITALRLKTAGGTVSATASGAVLFYYNRLMAPGMYLLVFSSSSAPVAGDYTLEVDVGGATVASQPIPYAYHSIQPLDPLSLSPSNNHYFKTLTPTFSWSATSDQQASYQVRLFSNNKNTKNIEVYRSNWMMNTTSWRVPEGVLKEGMTYVWRLYTSSDYDSSGSTATGPWHSQASIDIENNGVIGVLNSFTINPASHLKGDLNNDGVVDLTDVILGLQLQAGMKLIGIRSDYATAAVDVNGDNKLGLAEVIFILQKAAGMR